MSGTNMRKKEYIMSIEEYLEANLKTIQGMETHSKRYKEVDLLKFPREVGMVPVRLFIDSSRSVRDLNIPNS